VYSPIIYENNKTPVKSKNAMVNFSISLFGAISPKPTVVKDVNEKYMSYSV